MNLNQSSLNQINSQQGMNLVSLMIAVLISSLTTIATFTFFIAISANSKAQQQDSSYEGDLSLLLTTIEMEVLNSGYMLSGNDHILVEKIADLYKIYYRFKDSNTGNVVCRSIEEILVDNENGQAIEVQIQIFVPTHNCSTTDSLKSMRWDQPVETLIRFEDRSTSLFHSINLSTQKCAPFMVGETFYNHQMLTIQALSSVEGLTHDLNLCLINL